MINQDGEVEKIHSENEDFYTIALILKPHAFRSRSQQFGYDDL